MKSDKTWSDKTWAHKIKYSKLYLNGRLLFVPAFSVILL